MWAGNDHDRKPIENEDPTPIFGGRPGVMTPRCPRYLVNTLQVTMLHLATSFSVCGQVMTMTGSLLKMKTLPPNLGVTQGS